MDTTSNKSTFLSLTGIDETQQNTNNIDTINEEIGRINEEIGIIETNLATEGSIRL